LSAGLGHMRTRKEKHRKSAGKYAYKKRCNSPKNEGDTYCPGHAQVKKNRDCGAQLRMFGQTRVGVENPNPRADEAKEPENAGDRRDPRDGAGRNIKGR